MLIRAAQSHCLQQHTRVSTTTSQRRRRCNISPGINGRLRLRLRLLFFVRSCEKEKDCLSPLLLSSVLFLLSVSLLIERTLWQQLVPCAFSSPPPTSAFYKLPLEENRKRDEICSSGSPRRGERKRQQQQKQLEEQSRAVSSRIIIIITQRPISRSRSVTPILKLLLLLQSTWRARSFVLPLCATTTSNNEEEEGRNKKERNKLVKP